MNASAEESELVQALTRNFPALATPDPQETWRRAERFGLVVASMVAAGPQALAQRAIVLGPAEAEALVSEAGRTTQARRGGIAFLVRLRGALKDQRFAQLMALGAQVAMRTHQAAGGVTATGMAIPTAQPAAAKPPVRELAGFELVAQLGEGAMGKVFKARQKSLDRFVALKVLASNLALDSDYVDRFHREARAAASLHHPNVVGVIDQGTDPAMGVHYIAFEFIDGQDLEEVLRARGKLPEKEVLSIGRGVAEALVAASRAGIVHRDVKPGNVIVGKDGIPKLVDLGLARKVKDPQVSTSVEHVMGTPAYMSPEQALGHDVDERTDLYSLGLTLFRLLTARNAFEAETAPVMLMMHVEQDCPDPRTFEASISEGMARLVLRLAARDKNARYASAADALRDIEALIANAGSGATPRPATGTFGVAAAGVMGGTIPGDPAWSLELVPQAIPDASLAPAPLSDPAEALLATLERTGDPEKIQAAIERFEALIVDAGSDAVAQAKAEASLARAYLLRGDRAHAEQRAVLALEKDPRCRGAIEVHARAARGDAERCRLETGLAHVRGAVLAGKLDLARKLAERIREAYPSEPHPLIALAVIAKLAGDEADFVDGLRRAWNAFPSKERADANLGGLDGLAADVLVAHGRSVYRGDGSLLRATYEGLDEKSNLIAGALRMAIALARVALERGGLTLFEQRRLHFAIARALSGLRRYDAALDELARASQFNPSEPERSVFEAEKRFINYMKNVLETRPGARSGAEARYRDLGAAALVELARNRLAVASKERAACTFELEKVGAQVAALAQAKPNVRVEVRRAADRAGAKDPFELMEPVERELADIAKERAQAKSGEGAKPSESSGERMGFLSKLKGVANAAAAGVAGAAKEAQLMLRETQAKARYDAAVKRFAAYFAKDLAGSSGFGPELAALARKAQGLSAKADWYWDEEGRAKKDIERLSPLA